MLCKDCVDWTNGGCDRTPSQMDNIICLLRHICIHLNEIVNKELGENNE